MGFSGVYSYLLDLFIHLICTNFNYLIFYYFSQSGGRSAGSTVHTSPTLIVRELSVLCRPSESEWCGESVAVPGQCIAR